MHSTCKRLATLPICPSAGPNPIIADTTCPLSARALPHAVIPVVQRPRSFTVQGKERLRRHPLGPMFPPLHPNCKARTCPSFRLSDHKSETQRYFLVSPLTRHRTRDPVCRLFENLLTETRIHHDMIIDAFTFHLITRRSHQHTVYGLQVSVYVT